MSHYPFPKNIRKAQMTTACVYLLQIPRKYFGSALEHSHIPNTHIQVNG